MNKAELIERVAERAQLTKRDADAAVSAVLEEIVATLLKNEEVKLSGFGIFEVKERAARDGTNPATQEKIHIPASKSVGFKVSKALKERLG